LNQLSRPDVVKRRQDCSRAVPQRLKSRVSSGNHNQPKSESLRALLMRNVLIDRDRRVKVKLRLFDRIAVFDSRLPHSFSVGM
jgi:hypothetical protein